MSKDKRSETTVYTREEWERISPLIHDACLAEEMFSPDELEEYARAVRQAPAAGDVVAGSGAKPVGIA
jgi:hypothetical protein